MDRQVSAVIVDENAERRTRVSGHLIQRGYDVRVVSSAQAGLDALRQQPAQLVLMSVNVAGDDGVEALARIKANTNGDVASVIVMAAPSEMDKVIMAIHRGADDYMLDPCSPELLDAQLAINLERKYMRDQQYARMRTVEKLAQCQRVGFTLNTALSTESNLEILLQNILRETMVLCNAGAGAVYTRSENDVLRMVAFLRRDEQNPMEFIALDSIPYPQVSMFDPDTGEAVKNNVIADVAHNAQTIAIDDIYESQDYDFSALIEFDRINNLRCQSCLVVPLMKDGSGHVMGVLQLFNAEDDQGRVVPFDSDSRLVAESLAMQAAVVINNHMLLQEREMLAKLENDIHIGRRIQSNFLPSYMPKVKGLEISARFRPAREVAGDFYDVFFMMNKRRVGFLIADVTDKGVGAALFMSLTRSLLRAFAMQTYNINWAESLFDDGPSGGRSGSSRLAISANALRTAVVNTNEYITEHHLELNMFATLFFGMLDPHSGSLMYINGGHCPPLVIGSNGIIKERLEPTGPAVGMFPGADFEIMETQLERGDFLLCYTDGVTDARDPSGKFYAETGLLNFIESAPLTTAQDLLDRLDLALRDHIREAVQFDDITMLALRRE